MLEQVERIKKNENFIKENTKRRFYALLKIWKNRS